MQGEKDMTVDSQLMEFRKYDKPVTERALKRILEDIKKIKPEDC